MVTPLASYLNEHVATHVTPLGPLQEIVASLRDARCPANQAGPDEADHQPLLQKIREAGITALPALLRSLASSVEGEADWACFLFRELFAASSKSTKDKILRRLNLLLVDARLADGCKARVLGLLADLRAPIPEHVVLEDPDALLKSSVTDLLGGLDSPQALDQALDLIFEQVPESEFENLVTEIMEHGGQAAQPLLSGLVVDPRTPRPLAERMAAWVRPAGRSRAGQALRTPSRPRMQRALRLLSHGQLGPAHEELLALRAQRSDDPTVLSALGLCLLRLAKPEAALEQLEQAAALAPAVASHAWNAAVAAHLSDQPGRCYRSLQQYLGCTDERHGAAARRQAATALCSEFERLISRAYPGAELEQVLESEALFEGAYEALRDARYAAAVEGFRAVLERLPAHPASWRNLGIAYLGQRRPREAARCFSRVLRLDPRHLARVELD